MYGFLPPIFAPSFGTRKLAGLPGESRRDAETAKGRRYIAKPNSKKPATLKGGATKIRFKGTGRRPAVQNQIHKSRRDAGGAKKLDVV
jgi:hypothetical protein